MKEEQKNKLIELLIKAVDGFENQLEEISPALEIEEDEEMKELIIQYQES